MYITVKSFKKKKTELFYVCKCYQYFSKILFVKVFKFRVGKLFKTTRDVVPYFSTNIFNRSLCPVGGKLRKI